MTGWATLAHQRAVELKDEISELQEPRAGDQNRLRDLSERLKERTGYFEHPHHRAWLSGDAIYQSWRELHQIEEQIGELTPDSDSDKVMHLVHRAEQHAEQEMPAKKAKLLVKQLDQAAARDRKAKAIEVIQDAHNAAEERHESERNQQRGTLYFAAFFFVTAVAAIVVQAIMPAGDRIIPAPSNGTSMTGWQLLALVMLFGMLGGALSALVSLYIGDKKLTNTLWFDPRPALALVKVAMGMWTAVLGILAVATGALVGGYTSLASVLLLAFVFGYAQQTVTGFIDRKAADIAETQKS